MQGPERPLGARGPGHQRADLRLAAKLEETRHVLLGERAEDDALPAQLHDSS